MIHHYIKTDHLFILGKGRSVSRAHHLVQKTDCDVWTMNDYILPCSTIHFEMHDYEKMPEWYTRRLWENWIRSGEPFWIVRDPRWLQIDRINGALYPTFDRPELYQDGQLYAASTGPMLIYLAVEKGGFKRIDCFGFDMDGSDRHTLYQRSNLEFCIGWAMGRGVTVVIHPETTLLTTGPNTRKTYPLNFEKPS